MKYNISINSTDPPGLNLSIQTEAPNVIAALDAAKDDLAKTIKASGLSLTPPPG